MKSIVLLSLLIGIFFVIPSLQIVFAQTTIGIDRMVDQLRLTHSQLLGDIDLIKQSLQSNNTSQTLSLLDDMDVKVDRMNSLFNDMIWQFSNRGH